MRMGSAGAGQDRGVPGEAAPVVAGAEEGDVPAGLGHAVTLMEVDVEAFECGAQELGRDRGGPVGDRPQGRQRGTGGPQVVEQCMQHRRSQ